MIFLPLLSNSCYYGCYDLTKLCDNGHQIQASYFLVQHSSNWATSPTPRSIWSLDRDTIRVKLYRCYYFLSQNVYTHYKMTWDGIFIKETICNSSQEHLNHHCLIKQKQYVFFSTLSRIRIAALKKRSQKSNNNSLGS